MYNFELKIPTEIYFGVNVEEQVGKLMKPYASKVMLVYGSERIFNTGLGDKIVEYLEAEGCQVIKQGGVKPNADTSYIESAINVARQQGVDGIVAIGGGSVIDSAKAISATVHASESVVDTANNASMSGENSANVHDLIIDIYKGEVTPEKFIPIGAIVTVPATASESNGMSVVTDSNTHQKYSRYFEGVIPKFALLNPELTLTVSTYQTAVGGFDIFSHAFERFFDLRRKSMVLDEMTMGVMRTMVKILPELIHDPLDMQKRSDMMFAATVAHNNMLGPGGDFACHAISHGITKSYGIAHGGALAMITPAWCEYMKDRNEERFKTFFKGVFDTDDINEGIHKLKAFVSSIGLPLGIKVDCDETEYLADSVVGDVGFVGGGFDKVTKEDVVNICRKFLVTVA